MMVGNLDETNQAVFYPFLWQYMAIMAMAMAQITQQKVGDLVRLPSGYD
jgi:hypothetical protein